MRHIEQCDGGLILLNLSEPPSMTYIEEHNDDGVAKRPGHYMLACNKCSFAQVIPETCSVNPDEVKVAGDYLSFRLALEMKGFFTVTTVPTSSDQARRTLVDVKELHCHMLSHCHPLFLTISHSRKTVTFTYSRNAAGSNYVEFYQSGMKSTGQFHIVGDSPGILVMILYD